MSERFMVNDHFKWVSGERFMVNDRFQVKGLWLMTTNQCKNINFR